MQSLSVQSEITTAIAAFEQYDAIIMSELKTNQREEILKMTHFTLSVIEFSREIIILMGLIKELSIEVSLRRRLGRLKWLKGKIIEYYTTPATLFTEQPNQRSLAQSISFRTWMFFKQARKFEFKFAFKTATLITLMAIPAFVEDWQDIYYEYRLNWAMTSAIVVLTPSVGGTNLQGLFRLLGTWVGATIAVLVWLVGDRNPYILGPLCFLLSIPAFTLILKTKYNKLGRVSETMTHVNITFRFQFLVFLSFYYQNMQ